MIDCPSCGNRIEDSSKHWCSQCGTKLKLDRTSEQGLSGGEKAGICIGNICLSPLLGVILYYVWKDEKPKKANEVCGVTLLSAAVVALGIVLSFFFSLATG